jgi:hypothetical protein
MVCCGARRERSGLRIRSESPTAKSDRLRVLGDDGWRGACCEPVGLFDPGRTPVGVFSEVRPAICPGRPPLLRLTGLNGRVFLTLRATRRRLSKRLNSRFASRARSRIEAAYPENPTGPTGSDFHKRWEMAHV